MHIIQFLQDAISALETCRVPVIAAVDGQCIGGAIDLITACDLRFCTDSALFCIKETDLAMVADIGTLQRLPRIVGDQRCRYIMTNIYLYTNKQSPTLTISILLFFCCRYLVLLLASVLMVVVFVSSTQRIGVHRSHIHRQRSCRYLCDAQ